jgi:hypothetical protein
MLFEIEEPIEARTKFDTTDEREDLDIVEPCAGSIVGRKSCRYLYL